MKSSVARPIAHASTPPKHGGLLVARELYLTFGQTPALRGASMEVGRGEVVALVGASGSGKSTLLHSLAGVLTPDSGEVWFDGELVSGMNDSARTDLRRRCFGFVMQFGQLVPDLSVAENVSLPLMLLGHRRAAAMRAAREALEGLGIQDLAARMPGQLSGGEQQRAAVARALIARPRVVFADEPTGALDSENGGAVMSLLTSGARAVGTTVVLVTHDPSNAALADRTVVLSDGRVSTERAA